MIDLEVWTFGGPGGAGALRFLLDRFTLLIPVKVLMAGEVGLSPGVAHPDPELILLSPAL